MTWQGGPAVQGASPTVSAEVRLPAPLRVSVITVALNAASTIEETLASVLEQRAPFAIEHVCVDGGSKDGTRDIIDRYAAANPLLRRIYEPDHGLYDAMNKGVRAAKGDYLVFLNADDYLLHATALADVMASADDKPGLRPDVIAADVVMGQPGVWGYRYRRPPALLYWLRWTGMHPPHQGLLLHRSVFEAVGGFRTEYRVAADVIHWWEVMRRHPVRIHLPRRALSFMRSGATSNGSLKAHWRGNLEAWRFAHGQGGVVRAAVLVTTKLLQKVAEVRFARPIDARMCPNTARKISRQGGGSTQPRSLGAQTVPEQHRVLPQRRG
ncbi:MAG: glycosyltransferase family 2 protein [bacterium]|jgi:glycosyltransferase involved in cell wall biosynthesis